MIRGVCCCPLFRHHTKGRTAQKQNVRTRTSCRMSPSCCCHALPRRRPSSRENDSWEPGDPMLPSSASLPHVTVAVQNSWRTVPLPRTAHLPPRNREKNRPSTAVAGSLEVVQGEGGLHHVLPGVRVSNQKRGLACREGGDRGVFSPTGIEERGVLPKWTKAVFCGHFFFRASDGQHLFSPSAA